LAKKRVAKTAVASQEPQTEAEALAAIAAFPEEKKPDAMCALVGHSRMIQSCVGQLTCARCDAIVGDTLAGASVLGKRLVRGHGKLASGQACKECVVIARTLTWRDTALVEFTPEQWMEGSWDK